jgi:protein-tyrosine-phosphatase
MRVLVLCHGNINRSPFVAALIAHHRPGWIVTSAGLHTKLGRRASRKARAAAAKRGLSLETHRSTPVTWEMVLEADRTLYMDGGNERRLDALIQSSEMRTSPELCTSVRQRCELLATYGSLRRLPDPNYTSDPELLRQYFGQAELCTMKFLEANPA